MSSEHSHFAENFAAALQSIDRAENNGAAPEPRDIDRLAALIDAATASLDLSDPGAVEAVFATQALALDSIFNHFIRRRGLPFDNMRVALRAQAQCRATFKLLSDFKHPRPSSSVQTKNSSEQTVESAKTFG